MYGAVRQRLHEDGGTIDPPTPVGSIAATIEAPNLSITPNGVIQNVGNVIGTSVTLTGQKLINGITSANTYTPRVNAPSQVIPLSPVNMPGLNLSTPRQVGAAIPTLVAGQASYVDQSLGASAVGSLSPQALLDNLPANLQSGSTLFYYNPQEEDLMLQQAALQQTGKASFIDGLSYNSKTDTSVTEQEKAYLYQNALDYGKANNLQLGDALTQTQVSALDKPILWYVDPNATALSPGQSALVTALSMLAGAGAAGALGQDGTAAATSAGNESLNNDQASLDHIKAAIGSAKAAGAWLNSFGTAMVTSTGNTLKESALQLFDNAFYSGLPGTPQPQSALYQSIAQNGLLGTAQSVGTGLLNTAQGVMAGNPTAIGSIAGNVVLGVALDRIANAGQAAVAVEGAPAGVAYTYDAMNPGPLRDTAAGTFAGGRYSVGTIQSSDQILFKAGDASNPGGSFINFEMPQSVAQARIDDAVKPYWVDPVTGAKTAASPINSVIAAQFPAGTTYYYGPVGTQGGVYVGGQNSIQIFMPNARAIGTFTPIKSLR